MLELNTQCGVELQDHYYKQRAKHCRSCSKTKYLPEVINSPLHHVWTQMKRRCLNPKVQNYHNYGGRGITVCSEWMKYQNFYNDMAASYKPGLTIDRINNDGPYSKENCRWATKVEQGNNRRTARLIEYRGQTKHMNDWAKESGVKISTFKQRLYVYGWPIEKCMEVGYRLRTAV